MGDVGERPAVHERGRMRQRLHQIRLDGVLQQRSHCALRVQLSRRDRSFVIGVGHDELRQPFLEVGQVPREAEHRHDLGGHGDGKAVLARHAVGSPAETVGEETELTVVHVDAAPPNDAARVDLQLVALIDMVVDHSRQQVVRRADGMEVAREMEIDVLHRRDLRIAAPGRPALEAEHRPERRLAQSEHRILAQQPQRVAKADRRGGLALPGGCRVDCRDQDQLAGLPAQRVHLRQIELGLIASVRLERRLVDPGQTRDLSDWEQGGLPRDFQIRFHADSPLHSCFL